MLCLCEREGVLIDRTSNKSGVCGGLKGMVLQVCVHGCLSGVFVSNIKGSIVLVIDRLSYSCI